MSDIALLRIIEQGPPGPPGPAGNALTTPVSPHQVLVGPNSGSTDDVPAFRDLEPIDIPFAADLNSPNNFQDVQKVPGLRVGVLIVTSDYTATSTDFAIEADASAGQITVTFPQALGTGQVLRVKKTDLTDNLVIVSAYTGDLIDDSPNVVLTSPKLDCTVIDVALETWDRFISVGQIDPTDIARLSRSNQFLGITTFAGIRVATRTVSDSYTLTSLDFELSVDASAGPVDIQLPPATDSGQYFRVKKIDITDNLVRVLPDGSDLIDDSISVNLITQFADCALIDAGVAYWDNTGPA